MATDSDCSQPADPGSPGARPGGVTDAPGGPDGALAATVGLGVGMHALGWFLVAAALPHAAAALDGAHLVGAAGAVYLTGMVVAGAAAAWVAMAAGLWRALAGGGAALALGVAAVALAPNMTVLVAGRLVEGLGGGLVLALCYALLRRRVPVQRLPRAFGLLALVYAATAAAGPTLGGGLIESAGWRWAVAAILLPAVVFLLLLGRLDRGAEAVRAGTAGAAATAARNATSQFDALGEPAGPLPLRRLVLIAAAALAVAASGGTGGSVAAALLGAGALGLVLAVRLDKGSAAPLLPAAAFRRGGAVGAGLMAVAMLPIAAAGIPLYAPLIHVLAEGGGGVASGLLVATHALAWSAAALAVARLPAAAGGAALVAGPLLLAAGLGALIAATAVGTLAALVAALVVTGSGFGTCWAFLVQRITAAAAEDGVGLRRAGPSGGAEGDRAATAIPTVQATGEALGAGLAGLLAGLAGVEAVAAGDAPAAPLAAAIWGPAAALALLAVLPALRLARTGRPGG